MKLSGQSGGLRRLFLCWPLAFLLLFLAWPLLLLALRAFEDQNGLFIGLDNFREYLATPQLLRALGNTLGMAAAGTLLTLCLAFTLAYSLTHARARGRRLCAACALLPLFSPSFAPAMGLIYLFGEQGPLKWMLGGHSLYGPLGVLMGSVIYSLPFAFLLLENSLAGIDRNLYLAARALGASRLRIFYSVTLPQSFYALLSAGIAVFTLSAADFGVPKVLGGDFAMLSTEIFKQVTGMHNFPLGAAVSLVMLLPAIPAFLLNNWANAGLRRQRTVSRAGKAALAPEPRRLRDAACTLLAWVAAFPPLAVSAMLVFVSLVGFWPYDLSLTLDNYAFRESVYGFAPYVNSLCLALGVALGGTLLIFSGAWLSQRFAPPGRLLAAYSLQALLPLCLPGAVLGLAYIFAFNEAEGLWGLVLRSGPLLLILNSIIHLYPVPHLAFTDSLNALGGDYENVGAGLGASRTYTLRRVILPLQRRALAEAGFYLFAGAMTTISALVFIYTPKNIPAQVAALQMFDSGKLGEAAAMSVLILFTALAARGLAFMARGRN